MAVGIRIRRGYHINSNRPNEPYLIPTSLSWNQPPFRVVSIEYPPAEEVRYDFSEEPLSVYSSRIEIVTTFLVEGAPESSERASRKLPLPSVQRQFVPASQDDSCDCPCATVGAGDSGMIFADGK